MTIDRFIARNIVEQTFPGIVLLIVKQGKELFRSSNGYRQIFPSREEMTFDTFFDLASLTKPLSTTPVALTVFERENIKLSASLGTFLDDIPPETKKITLSQLVTHSSGLPPVPDIFKLFKTDKDIDMEQALAHLYSLVPECTPGSRILYSCTGYIYLTRVIMKITGKSLSELFREIITQPAHIDSLMFNPPEDVRRRTAATEYCTWRKRWIKGEVHDENSYCLKGEGGNAGLFGTVSGIMKLLGIISSGGVLEGEQILSPAVCAAMTTCQSGSLRPKRAAGFLMQDTDSFAGDLYSRAAYGHTGFTGTSVWVDPVSEIQIVVLTNRVHYGREKTAALIKNFRKELHSLIYRQFC